LSAKFSGHVSHPCFICFDTRCPLALLTDVSGGRIRTTRTRLIVRMITPHRTHLTITKTRKGRPRPDPGCSTTDDDDDYIYIYIFPSVKPKEVRESVRLTFCSFLYFCSICNNLICFRCLYVSLQAIKLFYDLELSRRLCIIKSSRATSRVKWLKRWSLHVLTT
jgi:hypothetical protein